MVKHHEVHPEFREGCYGCHLASVNVGGFPSAPTLTERRWDRDMASYKALRREGLQPPQIDGSHELEGASEPFEIEYGSVVPKAEQKRVKEAMKQARDIEMGVA